MKRLHELEAYVTGELGGAAADAFEDAMFDAPDDPDLAFLDRLARHGATLAAHGTFDVGVSRAQLDKLIASGHAVQILDAGPPTATLRTLVLERGADMIVTRFAIGRTDLERVDVEILVVEQQVTKVMKDVLVDRGEGVIYGICERPLAELAYLAGPTIARVRRCDGDRAVVGEWHLAGQLA